MCYVRWQKYCCYDIASMYDNHVIQMAQLSQRDSSTWWPLELGNNIYGHYRSIFNHCDVIGPQSNWIFFKFHVNVCNSWTLRALMVSGWAATDIRMDELTDNTRTDAKMDNDGRTDGQTNGMVRRMTNRSISYVLIIWKANITVYFTTCHGAAKYEEVTLQQRPRASLMCSLTL